MAQIIDFQEFKEDCGASDEHDMLLDLVVMPSVSELIEAAGFLPMQFTLNEASCAAFYQADIHEADLDERVACPYYDRVTPDALYRAETSIEWISEDEFETESMLYCLRNYQEGNREWLYFEPEDGWLEGPGEDFFDIEDFEGL